MSHLTQSENNETPPRIRRGKVDSLILYEITDYELDTLEKGMPSSLFLNIGIALVSISISFLASLFTTQITSDRTFIVFTVIVVVGFVAGSILIIIWYRTRHQLTDLINKIKNRIPVDEFEPIGRNSNSDGSID